MATNCLECPHCGGPIDPENIQPTIRCRYCGHVLDLSSTLCPDCGLINQGDRRFCSGCGAALVRNCPACHAENWAGNENCVQCGRTLDLLEVMTRASTQDTRSRLLEQQIRAFEIKRAETRQAEERMAYFRELERQSLEQVRQGEATQKASERRFTAVVLFSIALFVLGLIMLALIYSLK